MNKHQEALKELKEFVHSELDGTRMLDEYLKHCDTLQELVDKATPKKPIIQKELPYLDFEIPTCPNCGLHLSLEQRYCDRCGQALDWSDKNGI